MKSSFTKTNILNLMENEAKLQNLCICINLNLHYASVYLEKMHHYIDEYKIAGIPKLS